MNEVQRLAEAKRATVEKWTNCEEEFKVYEENTHQELERKRSETERAITEYRARLKDINEVIGNLWVPYLEDKGFRRRGSEFENRDDLTLYRYLEKHEVHVGEKEDRKYLAEKYGESLFSLKTELGDDLYIDLKTQTYDPFNDSSRWHRERRNGSLIGGFGGITLGMVLGSIIFPPLAPVIAVGTSCFGAYVGFNTTSEEEHSTKLVFCTLKPQEAMENLEKILGEN